MIVLRLPASLDLRAGRSRIRCRGLPANQCKDWTTCAAARVLRSIMHDYGQYCPVARAAEILADRWTLLIIRELLADVHHFNELERGLPRMSRTLLAERLRRLQRTGVLERRSAARGQRTEYRLTRAGRELQPIIDQLADGARAGRSAIRGGASSIPSFCCGGCGGAFAPMRSANPGW